MALSLPYQEWDSILFLLKAQLTIHWEYRTKRLSP